MLMPRINAGVLEAGGHVELLHAGPYSVTDRLIELAFKPSDNAIFWSPCQRGSARANRQIITVHDCINIEFVYSVGWRRSALRAATNRILSAARYVVAISQATCDAIQRNYNVDKSKIVLIRSPMDVAVFPESSPATDINGPFVLMVANRLPHKNILFACQAFALSAMAREQVPLCIVGDLDDAARAFCGTSRIKLLEYSNLDDSRLFALYRDCSLFLSTSLAEGHNLPVAEALGIGAPVACSDIPVHREFFGGFANFFDPTDIQSATRCLDSLWTRYGPQASRKPVKFGRTADSVADDYLNLFATAW